MLGTWIGAFAYAPLWTTIFLAIGVGAILQVIVEVGRLLARRARADGRGVMGVTAAGGVAVGVVVMYATAFLVQV